MRRKFNKSKTIIVIVLASIFASCTSLKLSATGNRATIIVGLKGKHNAYFGIKQSTYSSRLTVQDKITRQVFKAKVAPFCRGYLIIPNLPVGMYEPFEMSASLGTKNIVLKKKFLVKDNDALIIARPQIYYLGFYEIQGDIHSFCCDTVRYTKVENQNFGKVINRIKKKNAGIGIVIDSTQTLFKKDNGLIWGQ